MVLPRKRNRKENAVSLLERLGRGHLSDATCARLWATASAGDQPAHPHLDTCPACRERFSDFGAWAMDISEEMRGEADELLTPERLAVQQAQIARRLETVDRPAKVIAFPKAARAVISGHSHVRRWVTVAAAASLIAGFGLGQIVPLRTVSPRHPVAAATLTLPRAVQRAEEIAPVVESISEDELLSDAFSRSHVSALSALDDMTPHARDILLNRRNK
jgi:hypothetical protein